jgi:hypothetical protein
MATLLLHVCSKAAMLMTLGTVARYLSLLIVLAVSFSTRDTGVTADVRAADCSYRVSPTSLSFDAAGGRALIYVTTEDYCTWIAESDRAWISVTSPLSGSGDGVIILTIAQNPSSETRTGTLVVGREVVVIRQDGLGIPTVRACGACASTARRGHDRSWPSR